MWTDSGRSAWRHSEGARKWPWNHFLMLKHIMHGRPQVLRTFSSIQQRLLTNQYSFKLVPPDPTWLPRWLPPLSSLSLPPALLNNPNSQPRKWMITVPHHLMQKPHNRHHKIRLQMHLSPSTRTFEMFSHMRTSGSDGTDPYGANATVVSRIRIRLLRMMATRWTALFARVCLTSPCPSR